MPLKIDLSNQKFGRLFVLSLAFIKQRSHWNCICDCGNKVIIQISQLTSGKTSSCGCYRRDRMLSKNGASTEHNKEYETWRHMIERCTNERHASYSRYGGRGITVCEEWLDFEKFFNDMGIAPEGYSIERIDNNKGYCKENCKWATMKEQAQNKTNSNILELEGKRLSASEWCRIKGIPRNTFENRIKRGWSIEQALTTPSDSRFSNKKKVQKTL